MKQGWTYQKVGRVFKTYSGGTPIKTHKEYYENGNIPWIRSGEVCRKYITKSEKFITNSGLENSSAKFFPIDTVLVAMYGATAAQVGILKIKATSNQAVCGILPNESFIPEFIYYWFKFIESNLASQAQGGAQPNISQEKIKNVDIPIISLEEQQRIVEYLDAAFAQIDELKANAEKQLSEARALFQAALTQAMQPKLGWQDFSFSQIIKLKSGDNLPAKSFVEGAYPVYGGNGIAGYHNQYNKEGGQIVIGRVGALCGNVRLIKSPFWLTDNGFEVILDKEHKMDLPFLTYLLNFCNLRQYARQAAQPVISNVSLKDIQLNIPPLSEQQVIVEHLDALSNHVKELEEISCKTATECDALKQALLRQIFE